MAFIWGARILCLAPGHGLTGMWSCCCWWTRRGTRPGCVGPGGPPVSCRGGRPHSLPPVLKESTAREKLDNIGELVSSNSLAFNVNSVLLHVQRCALGPSLELPADGWALWVQHQW